MQAGDLGLDPLPDRAEVFGFATVPEGRGQRAALIDVELHATLLRRPAPRAPPRLSYPTAVAAQCPVRTGAPLNGEAEVESAALPCTYDGCSVNMPCIRRRIVSFRIRAAPLAISRPDSFTNSALLRNAFRSS